MPNPFGTLSAPIRLRLSSCLPLLVLLPAAFSPPPAVARTAPALDGRIVIDGRSDDFEPDEAIFGINDSLGVPEESDVDSRWQDNDISQIYLTWDADSVYFAADGIINGNNMILLWDVGNPHPAFVAGSGGLFDGLMQMTDLNSWRRNFVFGDGFRPDIFGATWDGNTSPRLLTVTGANSVVESQPAGSSQVETGDFRSVATFQGTQSDRSFEFALPWWKFLGFTAASSVERRWIPALNDTVAVLPPGVRLLRTAGVITGGGDGTGGPDSAPDNLQGHEVDGAVQVTIDNWAIIDIDSLDNVSGLPGPDGLPDFGVSPKERVRFVVPPPVAPIRFDFDTFRFSRPYIAPEKGEVTTFTFDLTPALPPSQAFRTVQVSAAIYDMHGRRVRQLYDDQSPENPPRPAVAPGRPELDRWDGRDDGGEVVEGGVYILRLVIEPDQVRLTRPVGVVR